WRGIWGKLISGCSVSQTTGDCLVGFPRNGFPSRIDRAISAARVLLPAILILPSRAVPAPRTTSGHAIQGGSAGVLAAISLAVRNSEVRVFSAAPAAPGPAAESAVPSVLSSAPPSGLVPLAASSGGTSLPGCVAFSLVGIVVLRFLLKDRHALIYGG